MLLDKLFGRRQTTDEEVDKTALTVDHYWGLLIAEAENIASKAHGGEITLTRVTSNLVDGNWETTFYYSDASDETQLASSP